MTLAARLEDLEVTLEHMLMDVFVSLHTLFLFLFCFFFLPAPSHLLFPLFNLCNCLICHRELSLLSFNKTSLFTIPLSSPSLCVMWVTSPVYNYGWRPEANICSCLFPDALLLIGTDKNILIKVLTLSTGFRE